MFWLRIFFIFLKWVTYNKETVGVVCTSGSVGVSVCRTTWLTVRSEDVNKWGWRKCGDTKCLRGATVSCVPAGQATGTKVSEGHTHVRVPHGQHCFTQALKTRSFIFVCGGGDVITLQAVKKTVMRDVESVRLGRFSHPPCSCQTRFRLHLDVKETTWERPSHQCSLLFFLREICSNLLLWGT